MNRGTNDFFSVLRRHRSLVFELSRREFEDRYKGSAAGVLWAFAQPLLMLSIYALAFGMILKVRWGGSQSTGEYVLMMFAGLIVVNALTECMTRSVTRIAGNPNFVKKVVFPLELLPVVVVLSALMHFLIATLVWLVGYGVLRGTPDWSVLGFVWGMLAYIPLLLGVAWLFAGLGVFMKDLGQVTGIIGHALLFLTPVFYSVDMAPAMLQDVLRWNPLTYIVEQYRAALYFGIMPDPYAWLGYSLLASLFAWGALVIFNRLRPAFPDRV
ncbi:MAG: ABC transporter permease [Pseudomonadota bacterium]